MRFFLIVLVAALGCAGGLAACNDHSSEPAAPSMKRVDSVVAAAPDTIKAISVDSSVRKGRPNPMDTIK
jgi:hypothetical protein